MAAEGVRELLDRAANLLARAGRRPAPTLDDDAALRAEARRLRPPLEALVGRSYGRLPHVRYRRGLGARLAGPWSQYLTLGLPGTRLVLMTPRASSREQIPTVLAHELAHRYTFDESVTTLRGLELSARLAADGDPLHARSAPRELARMALGAALVRALAGDGRDEVERFLAERAELPALARTRVQWARLAARAARGRGVDVVSQVYAVLPQAALEAAARAGRPEAAPIPHPRFALDSAQAWAVAAYTGVDALTGRRRASVPLDATLALWSESRA